MHTMLGTKVYFPRFHPNSQIFLLKFKHLNLCLLLKSSPYVYRYQYSTITGSLLLTLIIFLFHRNYSTFFIILCCFFIVNIFNKNSLISFIQRINIQSLIICKNNHPRLCTMWFLNKLD